MYTPAFALVTVTLVPPKTVRFGVFEVDVSQGTLRKRGLRVRLRGRPFGVLAMLLERPGDLVTREELRDRLWRVDSFVDFDHGLDVAVNRLREALGDSADNPRFVETCLLYTSPSPRDS